ncbi:MAG: M48 family metallopeptidase [Ruminococcaceae bacterium]|nr:M48 family metallopeptidase [Oscillospiraceae bacterium]
MKRQIETPYGVVFYTPERKKVKNINLRIKPDGSVYVSANRLVPQAVMDAFVFSKAAYIVNAQAQCQNRPESKPVFPEKEIAGVITAICQKVYPYFEGKGVPYPRIRFRKMVSRWGSCNAAKKILTFNTNLMLAPIECISYVVLHEFTHFLVCNHSDAFYRELEKVCPDWKTCRKKLKEIHIR